MSEAFTWIDLPDGRARFSGLVRGVDEAGHDTFAIDLDGTIAYGEVRERYEGAEQGVEVVSFGFASRDAVGEPSYRNAVGESDAAILERLTRALIRTVAARPNGPDRPSTLRTTTVTRLSDEIVFAPDWLVVGPDGTRPASGRADA